MELFIQLILVLALIKYSLKAVLTGRLLVIACYGLGAALLAMVCYPIVIELPVTIVAEWLTNQTLVTNGAVLTTVEAVAGIFSSVYLLDNYFMKKEKRKRSIFVLKVLPGILSCIAIAYFELMFFKMRVGADFLQTALLYAALIGVSISGLALIIRYLIPEESLKLELKVLLNGAILVLGLLVNSSVADYNLSYAEVIIEWGALGTLLGIALALFIVGRYLHKINLKSLFKQK